MSAKPKKKPTPEKAWTKEHFDKRIAELKAVLAGEWAKRGQAAKDLEDADAQIQRVSHRIDEIDRAILAGKKPAEDPPPDPED